MSEPVRLQKLIAARGLASRRAAEDWIKQGRVTVDGLTATLGDAADPSVRRVEIDGVPLPDAPERVYIALYKPRGAETTRSSPEGRRTVMDILPPDLRRVVPAGRLDLSAEGLLILTDDGDAVYALTHPKHEVDKTYIVWVQDGGAPIAEALAVLRKPMTLDGQRMRGAKCFELSPGVLSLTIHEGKNRQVRRMCEHAGLHVTRLKRSAEGPVSLGDLKPGQWRHLSPEEQAWLRGLSKP